MPYPKTCQIFFPFFMAQPLIFYQPIYIYFCLNLLVNIRYYRFCERECEIKLNYYSTLRHLNRLQCVVHFTRKSLFNKNLELNTLGWQFHPLNFSTPRFLAYWQRSKCWVCCKHIYLWFWMRAFWYPFQR